jgi:hypothetical protein
VVASAATPFCVGDKVFSYVYYDGHVPDGAKLSDCDRSESR